MRRFVLVNTAVEMWHATILLDKRKILQFVTRAACAESDIRNGPCRPNERTTRVPPSVVQAHLKVGVSAVVL